MLSGEGSDVSQKAQGWDTHDFLWGEDSKLHFLHFADGGRRKGELVAEHDGRNANNGREEVESKADSERSKDDERRREKCSRGRIRVCRR
jgi:hypothetical protein